MKLRAVFMGSPDFAVPTLESLVDHYSIVAVVTQPDRPAGRGKKLTSPPVKVLAEQLGIPVLRPRRLREPEAMAQLHAYRPDLIVVTAFGQILRADVLSLPPLGCINVHASLLPRWRGAAPIQAAILNGDTETGVTIMKMDPGVDTGPMLNQQSAPILESDTSATLGTRLSRLGAQLLMQTLPGYLDGSIQPQTQDDRLATYAPMLKKEDGLLDFSRPAAVLVRQILAFNPWPGASIHWQDAPLKIHKAHTAPLLPEHRALPPGARVEHNHYPGFVTSSECLVLDEVQPGGKKSMNGRFFLQGARDWS